MEDGWSYYALWHCLTRVRWLIRTGKAAEAVALAEEALPRIERMADRNLLERMQLLAAEALARAGRPAEGAALHARAVRQNPDPPLEMIAEAARVSGCLAATGAPGAALPAFARAGRILAVLGHRTAHREVTANAAAALAATGAAPVSASAWLAPDQLPASTGALPPATTGDHALPDPRPAGARSLEAAAALMDLARHPPLAGRELIDLLAEAGAADEAVLAEQTGEAGWRPVAWSARTTAARAAALALDPSAVVLPLGSYRDHDYAVLVPSPASPARRATLLAIERVLAGATALHDAALRERDRAALWPEPSPEAQLGMVFAAESMVELVKTTRRVAAASVTVLITGETGTGKELLARALHESSARREKPFVPFNCTAVARDMLDSQLFGYRRGAFTGAHEAFDGVIRAAAGGTLFLDEIGEIGLDVQPKLLRFLESGEIHPLGEPRPVAVDVRIVAATNAPLEQLVADGRFREDLYYRLNIVRLEVPPLRERREEIPLLVEHFLDRWAREYQKAGLRLAAETMEYLVLYPWPGNVRQLANELRRMAALAESGAVLMPEHLSADIARSRRTVPASERDLAPVELVVRMDQPLSAAIEHLERALIRHAMDATGARVEDAARLLGLSRKGLYLKRQRLGLA
ncbi:MAG: sigma-54 interaction domain-containing protein [Vicinamibacterales bacterium]